MKKYRCQLIINLECDEESMDKAKQFFEDMEITFRDPNTLKLMDSDLIDWEINEVE